MLNVDVKDFMLFIALELRLRASEKNNNRFSYYLTVYENKNGFTLRISDLHFNARTAEKTNDKYTTSVTFSNEKPEDWDYFKADPNVKAVEYVYYEDKVIKDDLISIAKDIIEFVETGKFTPSVKPNEINKSPKPNANNLSGNQAHDTTLQKLELQLLGEKSPLKITIETFANIVKQYNSLKQNPKYKDVILIFATSKFEQSKLCSICEKDAEIAGKILKVKPTKLGLIFHRYYLEEYLSKLTRAGYRVGIVEEKKGLKGVDNWSVTELDGINFDDNKKNPIYYFVPSLNNAIFASDWNAKAYN